VDWSYVISLKKSKFNLFGSNEQQYCWKSSREHLLNQHVQLIVKYVGEALWFGAAFLFWFLGLWLRWRQNLVDFKFGGYNLKQ
jgi:hypothetical protein